MIFVTVGTDLPFDRLVRTVDAWAGETQRTDVFAQIGETAWRPTHIRFSKFLEPEEFRRCFNESTTIVAHAGMGTILSALQWGKPILVMPRQASLNEHRNEHQLATAKHLAGLGKIDVAFDEHSLRQKLERLSDLAAKERISPHASASLISALRAFIHQG
jgi:UDP-N-acetylglucosamine transferase subunit ALG13